MSQHRVHRVKSIAEFHKMKGLPSPQHPLISLFDYGTFECSREINHKNFVFDFYHISIKRSIGAKFKYGQSHYDFDDGVMFFIAPNQVFGIEKIEEIATAKSGWVLMIHPDFLWNKPLAATIRQYDFFDYAVNEALFLSEKEEAKLNAIVQNIEQEYNANMDKFSQGIIISQLETLLNYSDRFYQRQFLTRKAANHQILANVEQVIDAYFDNGNTTGLPTVQYVAQSLNISPMYLSSMLKSLTGLTTQQHIHEKLIEKAKEKLSTTELTVSQIAFDLGFEHSQSFSKLFKSKTSVSPLAFRSSFN
ncbi:helix-turn-helix transcriptional regulator [Flavobacterium sp. MFBS3-15]|uniref:helix-turn-helix domain-containing protein n=1 Tax=Flavobacterium sp. MFBS3-15 TaxID=2989816 RepID=UPI002236B643|nr:AraC family transcriptional regulator [Flavobacterium sp. MFBS3-15]MCW4467637.1 helix-turn-helix transcriptional regulator [Flavobacterium sp. MFBS3-15]